MPTELVIVEAELKIDGSTIEVGSASLREAVCEVASLHCEVSEGDATPEAKAVIGKTAAFKLERSDHSQKRFFHGLIVEAERFVAEDGNPTLRLHIAPRLWRLGKRADCRTYQNKSVPDVVKDVLERAGIAAGDTSWMLSATYPPRKYIVQYRETDLDFVQRLLSEEGIFFACRFTEGVDTLVFGDDATGFGDVSAPTALPFAHTFGSSESRDVVTHVSQKQQVKSDKSFVRDFDFERPKLKLEAKLEGKDDGAKVLEVYSYPGRFVQASDGERLAKVLVESMQAERDVISGEAGVIHLEPGFKFTVEEHPYDALNQTVLITSLEIEMSQRHHGEEDDHRFACRFTGVPTKTTTYRPRRRERTKAVPEVQTAFTTGPAGEELNTDKHARVKVQFHWDRLGKKDDTSSPWIRTCQLPTGGAIYIARVGWESVVRYEDGDVDRPMVFGRLYNGLTPPPYKLPEHKARSSVQTATTPGGGTSNEMRMDDTKGKEEMFFNASKDMSIDVNNNQTESVGNNESREIGSNHSLAVNNSVDHEVGASQTVKVGANQNVNVQTFMVDQVGGAHTLKIGANRNLKIGGDHKRVVGGASKVEIGGMMIDLVVGSVSESTAANMEHKVSAALVQMTTSDRSIVVGGNRTETTGAAKVVITKAGRGVEVGGMMMQKVAGAILTKVSGDRNDNSGANFTEVAAGMSVIKADNVTFEAENLLSFVMGASTITMTPASISIAGISIKLDGATVDTAPLVLDN